MGSLHEALKRGRILMNKIVFQKSLADKPTSNRASEKTEIVACLSNFSNW
jgi:hypothetical protein